ncbi:MAG: GNAT family N-acetyltransferase [Gammaproteobacteria bacterium]|nr:GNAT family N-acetyltransferase [Gammaproteobacteria bacterium]NNC98429.1 GNAT family N-acetyltransferase [Gammaproteobacteria bacterium]NNM14736.1 GNAT family N-acetyltransferase [Gammaproteobacteria bacterium]
MTLRQLNLSDLSTLQELGKRTFLETFGDSNSDADMQEYLSKAFTETTLKNEMLDPESKFFFAETDAETCGYLKINWGKAQTEESRKDALEIERIYVLSAYQGYKIGKQLFHYAIDLAKQREFSQVWLGVWEKNTKAIEFYKRQGFEIFDTHTFTLGSDAQTDYLMSKDL